MSVIEINPQFERAMGLLEHSKSHVFLTGRAGTGKSTLLQHFREKTGKKIAVLAPTGVAALNVRGQTIHSFFKLKPSSVLEDVVKSARLSKNKVLYRELDAIVIDEISMVRADLLDAVDAFLRAVRKVKLPFGGLQMVFIGDLYQLPPVVTRDEQQYFTTVYPSAYFFDAKVMQDPDFSMEYVELEKVYRQQEQAFIEVLNAVRNKTLTPEHIAQLNERVVRVKHTEDKHGEVQKDAITLTTTNAAADAINVARLRKIGGKPKTFKAVIRGSFDERQAPTDEDLELKVGAQIMMLANDSEGRWVNGTLGVVTSLQKEGSRTTNDVTEFEKKIVGVGVKLETGEEVIVEPHSWDMLKYEFDEESGALRQQSVGAFVQYPMRLAWAVTIHKAQGKTFDRVVIDFGTGTFAPGQAYVALSRCRTFGGLTLCRPMRVEDVLMDPRVIGFVTKVQYGEAEREMSLGEKEQILRNCVRNKRGIVMTYLRASDVKVVWEVMPVFVGEMSYQGIAYLGMRALCVEDGVTRTFKLDRILALSEGDDTLAFT